MLNCEICGKPLKQPKKTLYSRIPKYCSSKCRLVGARTTFKVSRNPKGHMDMDRDVNTW